MTLKINWNRRLCKISMAIMASLLFFTAPVTSSFAVDPPTGIYVNLLLLDSNGQVIGAASGVVDSSGVVVDALTGVPIGTTSFIDPIVVGFDSTPVALIAD